MKPSISRQHDLYQLTYNLPHRTFSSKIYPLRSSNGSSIIIYGHEQGLTIIWYGGKPFKTKSATQEPPKVNGSTTDEPMIIDLDDDDRAASQSTTRPAGFEDEEDEIDPARPLRDVLRHIDIPFGTAVAHLAVPHVTETTVQSGHESCPLLLRKNMVIAAACTDLSVRLISLPLSPPAPESTDSSGWNLQTTKIFGPLSHQDLISSVSITYTAETFEPSDGMEQPTSRSRSRGVSTSNAPKPGSGSEWSILIASTSCTGSGLLLIHSIPIIKDKLSESPDDLVPLQRKCLRSSLSQCVVRFNPCPYPVERHSNVLLASPGSGCVKVYQIFPKSSFARGRRGSATTVDSTTSSSRSFRAANLQSGRVLITLFPGFTSPTSSIPIARRKRVLDASWVLGGRAILVLLGDGEWGIWDLEAAGPSSASTTQNLVKGQSSVSGIQGGSLTRFAIRGSIAPSLEAVPISNTTQNAKSGGLVPLTPHTRKVKSDGLFHGSSVKAATHATDAAAFGRICVVEQQSASNSTSTKLPEETVILSYLETNVYIPSILAYWRSETSNRGSFDATSSLRPTTLPSIRSGGEMQHSIALMSNSNKVSTGGGMFGTTSIKTTPDVMVATDHRLILLVSPISESSSIKTDTQSLPTRALAVKSTDQALLTHGALDVDGMDRILSGMASGDADQNKSMFGKSVGFEINEDNDVDMRISGGVGTPTPKAQGRIGKSAQGGRRGGPRGRIFT